MQDNLTFDPDEGLRADDAPLSGYTKNQKIAAGALGVFAVIIILMWFLQLKASIRDPQDLAGITSGEEPSTAEDASESLKTKDTDSDGLTDYDELYTYKTSPYLEDSDSDGYADKEEVGAGKDPNCPQGKDCVNSSIGNPDFTTNGSAGEGTTTADEAFDYLQGAVEGTYDIAAEDPDLAGAATGGTGDDYEALLKISSGTASAAELRTFLLSRGYEKAMLDKFSDEELLQNYKDALSSQ